MHATNPAPVDTCNSPDVSRFLAAVTLTETEPLRLGEHARAFCVTPQYVPWPKAYGGDAVAQAAAAAYATVGEERVLHSLHSSFLRPVSVGESVRYEVEMLRDGRGYSTRHVRGYQGEHLVFLLTASFQVPEDGPTWQPAAWQLPSPEGVPTSEQAVAAVPGLGSTPAGDYWASGRSFDMRHVDGPRYVEPGGAEVGTAAGGAAATGPVDECAPCAGSPGEGAQSLWIRAFAQLPDDPRLHQLAIAYVCDYTILEPSLKALGYYWGTPGLMTASIDHAMWFHHPARADEWLSYQQQSLGIQSGRALGRGSFFTSDGKLVASVTQEGVVRRRKEA